MNQTLQIRLAASLAALKAMRDVILRASIPWHYGTQVKAIRNGIATLERLLIEETPENAQKMCPEAYSDGREVVIPWEPGELEAYRFDWLRRITEALDDVLGRMVYGPIAELVPEIIAPAKELIPIVEGLNEEGFRLESQESKDSRAKHPEMYLAGGHGPPWGFLAAMKAANEDTIPDVDA